MHILLTHSMRREGLRSADLSRMALIDVSIGLKVGMRQKLINLAHLSKGLTNTTCSHHCLPMFRCWTAILHITLGRQ